MSGRLALGFKFVGRDRKAGDNAARLPRRTRVVNSAQGYGAALAVLLVFTGASQAQPQLLTQVQIAEIVPGATFHLDSPLGMVLPVRFAPDGTMSGRASSTLGFFLGGDTDSGRWWIADGRLCKKWTKWFKAKANCVTLKREGMRLYWERPDGEKGTATIVVPAPPPAQIAKATPLLRRVAAAPAAPAAAEARTTVPQPPVAAAAPAVVTAKRPTHLATSAVSPIALPIPKPVTASRRTATAAPVAPPAGSITAPKYIVANVAMDDVLNVRAGPSHLSPIKATLPPDAAGLRIVGTCESGWCIVRYRAVMGWVNSYYLALAGVAPRDRS